MKEKRKKRSARALYAVKLTVVFGLSFGIGACLPGGSTQGLIGKGPPDSSVADPSNPPQKRETLKDVLLFNGTGVSTSDWQSTEEILQSEGLTYDLVNSNQMNAMTLADLSHYGVIVIPGGEGGIIARNLVPSARLNIRQAVRDHGVGYVGFCAGAWVAVGPEANSDAQASYGLAVAQGSVLPAYYPGGNTNLTAAGVPVTFANKTQRNLVWWGGPSTPEWSQGVVARYETGEPAISETFAGKGLVVIAGPHPEAPQGWRATAGNDPDGLDFDIAVSMIRAALNQKPLETY